MYRKDVEVGCNICYDHRMYIDDFVVGKKEEVIIPYNIVSIGTFHTHPNTHEGAWGFSEGDVRIALENRERYMFLKVDHDVYGLDLARHRGLLNRAKKGEIKLKRLTELLNDRKKFFQ